MTVFFGIIATLSLLVSIAPNTFIEARRTAKTIFWVSVAAMVVVKVATLIAS